MKHMLALLALSILSMNAFATPIPQAKLTAYKQAVSLAISNAHGRFDCMSDLGDKVGYQLILPSYAVDFATSADLNSNGSQPLLTFSGVYPDGTQQVITIVTSADYKSILSLEWERYAQQDVNLGDLNNPYITRQAVLIEHGICTAK